MITEGFAPHLRTTVNHLDQNPVHLLFDQFWEHADSEVIDRYRTELLADRDVAAWVEEGWFAEPLDLDALAALAPDTLGRAYRDWIVDNGLTAQIALDYRSFHERSVRDGKLAAMPPEFRYAVLRGFQVHDFLHVLTGYDPSPRGEIAVQAFSLAQLRFPYFAMWIATLTSQAAFVDPGRTVPVMDAICDGWELGRRTPQLSCTRWEELVDRPLGELRDELGLVPTALAARR